MGRDARRTLLLVVGLAAGAVLLCAGVARLGLFKVYDLDEARPDAVAFLDAVAEGRADDAYDATSARYRAGEERGAFRAEVARYPIWRAPYSRAVVGVRMSPRQAIYRYRLRNAAGSMDLEVGMAREGPRWRVDGLALPTPAAAPPGRTPGEGSTATGSGP